MIEMVVPTGPPWFVSEKFAVPVTPGAEAVTTYDPEIALAVNAADVAVPDEPVTAVLFPPANVPLAPLAGAVKVTVTPLTPVPLPFSTVATSGAENVALIDALCPEPLVVAIVCVPVVTPCVPYTKTVPASELPPGTGKKKVLASPLIKP